MPTRKRTNKLRPLNGPASKQTAVLCPCGCGKSMDQATGLYFPSRGFDPLGFKGNVNFKPHAINLAAIAEAARQRRIQLEAEQAAAPANQDKKASAPVHAADSKVGKRLAMAVKKSTMDSLIAR